MLKKFDYDNEIFKLIKPLNIPFMKVPNKYYFVDKKVNNNLISNYNDMTKFYLKNNKIVGYDKLIKQWYNPDRHVIDNIKQLNKLNG